MSFTPFLRQNFITSRRRGQQQGGEPHEAEYRNHQMRSAEKRPRTGCDAQTAPQGRAAPYRGRNHLGKDGPGRSAAVERVRISGGHVARKLGGRVYHSLHLSAPSAKVKVTNEASSLAEPIGHGIDSVDPLCCSAFQRGRVISARLLRSPVSSDCAFIPVGCSVSSRYTFPARGLARRCLPRPL